MKKIIAMLLASVLACAALTSCGASERYNYDLASYMTVGEYKTVELDEAKIAEDIQDQIDSILANYAEERERTGASEEGDVITYNVNASIDGEAVEALTADDNIFTVGTTETEFAEVNDALNGGVKTGDVRDITITVPEDYEKDETLRGKEVALTLSVTAIKYTYTPEELTDDMVAESTNNRYTTAAEYKAYLEKAIPQGAAFDAVLAATVFTSYPEKEAEEYYDSYIRSYQNSAAQYGMTLEQLVSMYGSDSAAFYKSLADQAIDQVQRELVIYYIYRTENLTVTDEMKDTVDADLVASYGYENAKEMKKVISEEALDSSYIYEAVLSYLAGNVSLVTVEETTEAVTDEVTTEAVTEEETTEAVTE